MNQRALTNLAGMAAALALASDLHDVPGAPSIADIFTPKPLPPSYERNHRTGATDPRFPMPPAAKEPTP